MSQKNQLIMMVGIVASGKSYIAEKIKKDCGYWEGFERRIFSSDSTRIELFDDINHQGDNKLVFKTLHKNINNFLEYGENKAAIYDSTNLSAKRRRHFINNTLKCDCDVDAVVMATPFSECIARNNKRDRTVPTHVMDKMYKSFQMPHYSEGFDCINLEYSKSFLKDTNVYDIDNELDILCEIEQNNPNHSLTIGGHCINAMSILDSVRDKSVDGGLAYSALLHDFGKKYTMQFKNYDSIPTDIAHYYGHESVSAYDAMFYLKNDKPNMNSIDIVETCNLIQFHMKPYFWTKKTKNRMTRNYGEKFVDKIVMLNKADKAAK